VKKVSKDIPKSFYSNPRLLTSLLDALMKCGDITDAESLFNSSTKKDPGIYGAMMKGYIDLFMYELGVSFIVLGYIKSNQANKAIDLFNEIKNPNDVIFILLFNACAQLRSNEALNLLKKVSKDVPKSFFSNPRLLTSLLDALVKCDDLTYAESLFNSSTKKDSGMYGVIMTGYNKENNPLKTLDLFNQMKRNGIEDKDNLIVYLCLIKALSQIGDYSLSESMIEQIPNDFLIDNQIQTALIDMWVS